MNVATVSQGGDAQGGAWSRVPLGIRVVILGSSVTAVQGVTALATAKWLGATERGVLSIAQTINTLAMLVVSGGLLQGTRVLLADPNGSIGLRRYLAATRLQTLGFAVLMGLLSLTALRWLGHVHDPWVALVWVLWSVALFRFSHLREVFHGLGKHTVALRTEVLGCSVGLVLVTAWWFFHSPLLLVVAMVCLGAGYAVAWLVQAVAVTGEEANDHASAPAGLRDSIRDLRLIIAFCAPGLVAALGVAVASRMDQLILASLKGATAVGIYAMASTISDLAWGIPLSMSAVIIRRARQADPSVLTAMHKVAWRRVVGSTALLSVFVVAGGYVLLEYVLGGDFRGSSYLVAVLVIGSLAMASQQVDLSICAGLADLRASAITALWAIPIGLISYFALIPHFGILGCAMANDLTFITMAVVARIVMLRRLRSAGLR